MSRTCSNKNEVFQISIPSLEKFVKPPKIHMMHVFACNVMEI